jgi:hypothetical protein
MAHVLCCYLVVMIDHMLILESIVLRRRCVVLMHARHHGHCLGHSEVNFNGDDREEWWRMFEIGCVRCEYGVESAGRCSAPG